MAKLLNEHRSRLEICIGNALIDKVRQIAKFADKPIWSIVEDAFETYIEEHDKLRVEQLRLNGEYHRLLTLLEQDNSAQVRSQIDEYNRQLIEYNERLARFHRFLKHQSGAHLQ